MRDENDAVDSDAVHATDDTVQLPAVGGPYESNEAARDDALAEGLALDAAQWQDEAPTQFIAPATEPPHRRLGTGQQFQPTLREPVVPGTPPGPDQPEHLGRRLQREAKKSQSRKRRKAPWWELPVLIAVAIAIAILVKTFVVQPFYIPSQSMEQTLHGCPGCTGDRILVNKPIYHLRDPHPGDIVVFDAPPGWDEVPATQPPSNPILKAVRGFGQLVGFVPPDGLVLVKRVIATGGQGVKGDADGSVWVSENGIDGPWRRLQEPYVYKDGPDSHAEFGPVLVPDGRLWVMGDHRNDSADSRFHCGAGGADDGPGAPSCDAYSAAVPVDDVIGKAVVIAWPPSRWRTLGTPDTFKDAAAGLVGALPAVGSGLIVVPIYLLRRRRRS